MLFRKSLKQDSGILPPPPPFPKLDLEKAEPITEETEKIKEELLKIQERQLLQKKSKSKIKKVAELKPKKEKKQKTKIDVDIEQLEKEALELPKLAEEKSKKTFLEILGLAKNPEEKEARQRAKEGKRKAEGERKKAKEEEKNRRELERRGLLEKREKIKIEKRRQKETEKISEKKTQARHPAQSEIFDELVETEENPLQGLEQVKTGKPYETSEAEQEIEKAIEDLKKKPKKPLSGLFMPKEKIKTHEMEFPEIPKEELPVPEIEEPTDDVTTMKHKIHIARSSLMDFDLLEAKRTYIEIMMLYNDSSPEKQAKVYEKIKDLYYERKNAEGLGIKA